MSEGKRDLLVVIWLAEWCENDGELWLQKFAAHIIRRVLLFVVVKFF
jgi:hypothetical protein